MIHDKISQSESTLFKRAWAFIMANNGQTMLSYVGVDTNIIIFITLFDMNGP